MEQYNTARAILTVMRHPGMEARLIRDPETTISALGDNFFMDGKAINILDEIKLDDRWTVNRKAVDFITALKSERRVKVEYDPEVLADPWFAEFQNIDQVLQALSNDFGVTRVRAIITTGKWYIE